MPSPGGHRGGAASTMGRATILPGPVALPAAVLGVKIPKVIPTSEGDKAGISLPGALRQQRIA